MGLEKHLQEYYDNEGKKLRETVDKILFKLNFGGIYEKDRDDFYSVANDVMANICNTYDNSQDFNGYVWSCLNNKIKTEMTRRNRDKRCIKEEDEEGNIVYIQPISIDTPIGENENSTLSDILPSDYDLEDELSEETGLSYEKSVSDYLELLSGKQKKIANLVIQGYTIPEIKEKLKLTEKQFTRLYEDMGTFEKSLVFKKNKTRYIQTEEDKQMQIHVQTQTSEKSRETQYSIMSLIKKMDGYTFRFNHPTQRGEGRWPAKMKGNLISDILQNNPLPELVFAEQIIDGVVVTWNLDGKQKSTNVNDFYNDKFSINKNVRRWNIEYQTPITDEDGKIKIFENDLPKFVVKTFDIRGKKFSQLPKELQERFLDYTFQCTQYLNCSDEDIEYHICRYNEGVRMNSSEKGMGNIGTEYAGLVKEIASMSFFKEHGSYTMAQAKNGTINRTIVEGMMTSYFLDKWDKNPENACSFMKDSATITDFENFTDMIDRLTEVVTDDVSEMFDAKDSFLWFGLFARFVNKGEDDEKFVEFMTEYGTQSLHKKEVDGITFEDLCFDKENNKTRPTKDKSIVVAKINLLEKLMNDFLNIDSVDSVDVDLDINIEETQLEVVNKIEETSVIESEKEKVYIEDSEQSEEYDGQIVNVIDFVRENVSPDITEEDITDYEEDLEILTLGVDNNSKLLDKENHNSLIALIAYTYKEDLEIDDWFVDYFKRSENYIENQKENYLHIKNDLHKYILLNQREAVAV